MKEIHYWITDDGQQFDSEGDALRHEDQLRYESLKDACICLDDQLKRVTPMEFPDSFNLLYLKTEEAYSWWKNYIEELGYVTDGVEAPGMYIYNYETFEWDNLENQTGELTKAKNALEGA